MSKAKNKTKRKKKMISTKMKKEEHKIIHSRHLGVGKKILILRVNRKPNNKNKIIKTIIKKVKCLCDFDWKR